MTMSSIMWPGNMFRLACEDIHSIRDSLSAMSLAAEWTHPPLRKVLIAVLGIVTSVLAGITFIVASAIVLYHVVPSFIEYEGTISTADVIVFVSVVLGSPIVMTLGVLQMLGGSAEFLGYLAGTVTH